jgi:exodeoxyribonuclease X
MSDIILRVVDVETTGKTAEAEVVEIAGVDVVPADPDRPIRGWSSALVKPTKPIPPEASAIHHITDEMVADAPPWAQVWPSFLDQGPSAGVTAFVAHNAKFEAMFLTEDMRRKRPLLCTFKGALHRWPEAPAHNNQTLRYLLKLKPPMDLGPPHRALADAYITAMILVEMLKDVPYELLAQWSAEPQPMPVCPIGKKEKGKPWSEVDGSFLDWALGVADMEPDIKWHARRELDRRAKARVEEFVVASCLRASQMATVDDLKSWFREQVHDRLRYGVTEGTEGYARILKACVDRKHEIEPPPAAPAAPLETPAAPLMNPDGATATGGAQ